MYLFVLDFLLIAQLGKRRLVFLFQLFYSCLIFLLGLYLFLLAAGHHRLVIVAVIMGFQIGFGISDQLVDLALVFFFNCLGRCQFSLQFGLTFRFFLRGIDAVALQVIQLILDIDSFFSTVSTKFIGQVSPPYQKIASSSQIFYVSIQPSLKIIYNPRTATSLIN